MQNTILFSDETPTTPADLQAEYNLIALAIDDNDIFPVAMERLSSEYFWTPELAVIWVALVKCYKQIGSANESTCAIFIDEDNIIPSKILYSLQERFDAVPAKGSEEFWIKRLESCHFRRQMLKAATNIEQVAREEDGTDEATLLAAVSQSLDKLAQKASCGDLLTQCRADLVAKNYLEYVQKVLENPNLGPVPTDLPELNQVLNGGFNRQEHYIVGARPGMGKTSFLLWNVCWQSVLSGKPTVFFSLEMTKERLMGRLLGALIGVRATDIERGRLNTADQDKLNRAVELLAGLPLYIYDQPFTIDQLVGHAKRMKAKHGIGLIGVDYIQLLTRGVKDVVLEVTENVSKLTLLARECDCPVITLSQLNRGVEGRQDKRPMLSDFAWSDRIGQDASAVIALYRDAYYNDESDRSSAEIIILKNRHGVDNITLDTGWDGSHTKYYDRVGAG